jgi:hypothetical protein
MTDQDIDHLMHMAAGYATWCVGMPDDDMMSLLNQAQEHLRTELAPKFGPDVAAVIAEAFPAVVISARRALASGAPPVANLYCETAGGVRTAGNGASRWRTGA